MASKGTRKLNFFEKAAYGLGAVGKDMVYMLSASYVLYYFQDIMGVSAWIMGVILLVARVFDALNDPIMGVIVAKTKTRWGKFRPWVFLGTLLNAVVLFAMFAAPPSLSASGLVAYAAVTYILWGVTYTMMDIPYWSMVPAFTESGKERENLSALARSCAGVGSAIISIATVMSVAALGRAFGGTADREIERLGFGAFALIVAIVFVVFEVVMCLAIKEKSSVDIKTAKVKDMFKSLVLNDQAMTIVIAIVLINTALYITNNLVIYFFKYDFNPANYRADYTLFQTFGGACQILAMMLFFPILRGFISSIKIFYISIGLFILGYVVLLAESFAGVTNVVWLFIPGFCILSAFGMLNVIVTIFLANTVDYGELRNNRRDDSVIFSMQTFVVKFASGISALIAAVVLSTFGFDELNKLSDAEAATVQVSSSSSMGLRLSMTILPVIMLAVAGIVFRLHYKLNDAKLAEITAELDARRAAAK